jgi:ABC-2 type transport system permease protein
MLAITKASFKGILKSPQAVFFSLFFPIVLITIFGAIGGNRGISLDIAFTKNSDTTNVIYRAIMNGKVPGVEVETGTEAELQDRLMRGRIVALIEIKALPAGDSADYVVHMKTTSAGMKDLPVLQGVMNNAINITNDYINPRQHTYATVTTEEIEGRQYRMIDFYLPGMLGFSLMGTAVFGVAFVFFSFRETLVLKRLFSTPVRKLYIVLGESLARIIFQLMTAVILIVFGVLLYNFTLAHGFITFLDMMLLCLMGVLVFMGFGYTISGLAKSQHVIPVYANLFMFPQFFLSGTFFPKTLLPAFLQPVLEYLPLTAMNDAMRKISFEGAHIWEVGGELAILLGWSVVAYGLAVKTFKWE